MNKHGEFPPYEPPAVVVVGGLAELTQGAADDISDDSQGQSYSVDLKPR